MSSKFIAMPVNQGDFFYLERDEYTIVFDGGMSEDAAPNLFKKYSKRREINYVVCSHNDLDHSAGIIGLLKDKELKIKEVWLPRLWKDIIMHISQSPNWIEEIIQNIKEEGTLELDDVLSRISSWNNKNYAELSLEKELLNYEQSIEKLINVDNYNPKVMHLNISLSVSPLLIDSVKRGKNIIEIAKCAHLKNIIIRWFDYDQFIESGIASGGESILRPLNSVENYKTRPTNAKMKLLYKLYLNKANREALVFISEKQDEPSVIFTADSNLKDVSLDKKLSIEDFIVTAPHHGSKHNNIVYSKINNSLSVTPYWFRSDMKRPKDRPCLEYINQVNKFCTACNSNSESVAIIVNSKGTTWDVSNLRKCDCVKK